MKPYRETETIYQLEYEQLLYPDPPKKDYAYITPMFGPMRLAKTVITKIHKLKGSTYKEAKAEAVAKCSEINNAPETNDPYSFEGKIIRARIKQVLGDELIFQEEEPINE
jgi:hypothetical protein